ncbi:MAG: hypothetical protein WCS77_06835 [Elusimicrobiaceae bacterium]
MLGLLLKRRVLCAFNHILSMKMWEFFVRLAFVSAGILILAGLYFWFFRVLKYLDGVAIVGPLLAWKLTAMALLMTFSMIAISSLISAINTLYYSSDLKFLFSSPVSVRALFIDRTIESALYSSWALVLVLLPYIFALGRIKDASLYFYLYFILMLIPFILLGAAFGIGLSMILMYFFPSTKTRDAVWVLGTLALISGYMMLRFIQPERLVNPSNLEVVAKYLSFLQAPTAEYMPSWWVTKGIWSFLYGRYGEFAKFFALLYGVVLCVYGVMVYFAKWVYMKGYSGAQEGRRQNGIASDPFERTLVNKGAVSREQWTMIWKDRILSLRDVRQWSQFALIAAIMTVYLFSIKQLPLEGGALKTLIAFFNISVAGFVVASIGLRFTFPAISLEGKSFWILRSAPISVRTIMVEKLKLLSVPSVLLGGTLVGWSNVLLNADMFVSVLSMFTIVIASFVCCVMGIGMGALFPRFGVENIHQIESSAGGFIYMACCMGYLAATVTIEAYPVKMHFMAHFAHSQWNYGYVALCAAAFIILNLCAAIIPWKLGLRALEKQEI